MTTVQPPMPLQSWLFDMLHPSAETAHQMATLERDPVDFPCKSFLASISETMSIASLFILLSRVWSSWRLFTLRLTRSCEFAT